MELATRTQRLLAQIVDMGSMLTLAALIMYVSGIAPKPAALVFAVALVALLLTQVYLLWKRGQTLGKIAMGIRIVRIDTNENGGFVTNVLLRTFLNSLITSIPILGPLYGLADAAFIFRADRRCLHDYIAKTLVVVVPQA
ncbi:MAG: hypothetical protein A2506_04530 [Elusimicrobia bacterium RIFOXYD12_FULL_66_9]|nr:MAG: hypothetical protein A2506_04530 [Elusimicrobia bacterium RIFOXYD12_FULL_66_9]